MSFSASPQHLRLVEHASSAEARSNWPEEQKARLEIIKENRIAAHASGISGSSPAVAQAIDPADPRWVLAMQTHARLQGATLPPERRDELLRNGRKLGLRAFEANLVIAIVQDQARAGGSAPHAVPMLSLVRPPVDHVENKEQKQVVWPQWLAAIAAAAAVAAALVRWLAS